MPQNISRQPSRRSVTGNFNLLPASIPHEDSTIGLRAFPTYSFVTWTLGRGSVIWRIWPAVILYTILAAVIVAITKKGIYNLAIPNIMLTVLEGVVIGFVISYRAVSGYDRYWMGKTCWTEVMKNSRTLGRLIWFHVPLRLSIKTKEENEDGIMEKFEEEVNTVMTEKLMALDLIEGFAVALKHHIRGEPGMYYEDLYHLVKPFHNHDHAPQDLKTQRALASASPRPRRSHCISTEPGIARPLYHGHARAASRTLSDDINYDPVIPPINAYGIFDLQTAKSGSSSKRFSETSPSVSSTHSEHRPLLPATQAPSGSVLGQVSGDLIPFAGLFSSLKYRFCLATPPTFISAGQETDDEQPQGTRHVWHGPVYTGMNAKHRPKVAGDGENLPLEILRCLSEWLSELEARGTVPGTSLGPMMSVIAAFEDNLTALERILTTPLPLFLCITVILISGSTLWIYLFFLPFQLVRDFGYYAIPGVAIASFIYLGFLAAGEEIEQPFASGPQNDLDLDSFCQDIIHLDIQRLKMSPCLNAYLGKSRYGRHASIAGKQTTVAGAVQNSTPNSAMIDAVKS
ncbi:hypothetical protein AMATHDRAFT_162578 [Amanita thiersii Skay4041]|uniref:Uncharacterized protein n=1 Tax=Amanita thiersii Skay4041 TaxID=703135 RepID=A0A2A9N632_9AGAR|nr:hypothetical protein AMATHDRAFT_162578 [Amanita thiersii Skay4041]